MTPAGGATGRQHVCQGHGGEGAHAWEVGPCTLRRIRYHLAARQPGRKVGWHAAAQPGQAGAAVCLGGLLLLLSLLLRLLLWLLLGLLLGLLRLLLPLCLLLRLRLLLPV